MSVKKHYQKRNQELNKDLMKRWGYAPPEEPIDEGLFDSLKNPKRVGRKKPGKIHDLGPISKEIEVGSMPGAEQDTSSVDAEKLKVFTDKHLLGLEKTGIGKDTDLYKRIEKSLKDAYVSMNPAPAEIEKAQEQPSSSPTSPEVIASNIAALEDWGPMWIKDADDFLELRRVMQSISDELGPDAVVSRSGGSTLAQTIGAINQIQTAVEDKKEPEARQINMLTISGGIRKKVVELVKKAAADEARSKAETNPTDAEVSPNPENPSMEPNNNLSLVP
tara:strand:- start:113 stop:940 length:828 start_codon:yes stop_codon:yes gene_type:complete